MARRRKRWERVVEVSEKRIAGVIRKENMTLQEVRELFSIIRAGKSRTSIWFFLKRNDVNVQGSRGRKSKIDKIPPYIFDDIKRWREAGLGYRYIASRLNNKYGSEGWYFSHNLIYRIVKMGVDRLKENAKEREAEEEKKVEEIIKAVQDYHRKCREMLDKVYFHGFSWEDYLEEPKPPEGSITLSEYQDFEDFERRRLMDWLNKRPVKHLVKAYKAREDQLIYLAILEKLSGERIIKLSHYGHPLFYRLKIVD